MNRRVWPVVALGVASAILSACGATSAENPQGEKSQPSQVQPIAGTKTSRVVLTAQAAGLLGIKTDLVRKAAGAVGTSAQNTIVPTAAIVYEADGTVWVYTTQAAIATDATGSLAFVRQPVVVLKVDGDMAVLQSGPPAGSSVVIVGAAELMGTESGVEGG
jgi:hypothetical protein